MFKKFNALFMSATAVFLLNIATMAVSAASLGHHGEPTCPKELLK